MRTKLKLQLDDLTVDSFDTVSAAPAKGTVFGEECTCPTACTCPGCPTCDATCPATCPESCDFSCGGTCDSCEETCDPVCYAVSLKYTNCNYACY